MDRKFYFSKLTFGISLKEKSRPKKKDQEQLNVCKEVNDSLIENETNTGKVQKIETSEQPHKNEPKGNKAAKRKLVSEINMPQTRVPRISVKGKKALPPIDSFQELHTLNISPKVIDNVIQIGYDSPTPIQKQAIPLLANGIEVLACAPTGSGKTAAFLIPIIGRLAKPRSDGFRALITCPTRELARQIYGECIRLTEGTGLKTHIISSVKKYKLTPKFPRKFDILISTPSRLIFLLNQENSSLSLESVEWLVVDEFDKMLEVGKRGFGEQLNEIFSKCTNENITKAMFSATYSQELKKSSNKLLFKPVFVNVGHRNTTVQDVSQELVYVGDEKGKLTAFRQLIRQGLHPPVLVFVQSKERAKELFNELVFDGINVDLIHSDRSQTQRFNVLRAFREGKIWVLICTELMGRGIDFKGVKLVVNYDFPQSAVSYIHRIGRTGRAGRPGMAVTYYTYNDRQSLRSIAVLLRESGCPVPEYMLKMKRLHASKKRKLKTTVTEREAISSSIHRKQKKEPKNN